MVRPLRLGGLILLLAALLAPPANAGVRERILRECQEGRITGNYTPGQLRDARRNIPTDIDEYSDCRDVLAQAALGGSSGGNGVGTSAPGGILPGGGTGSPLTAGDPAETAALDQARLENAPVTLGDERVIPGAAGFADAAARHGLPAVLVVVLVLLGVCALLAAVPSARRRVLARRNA